MISKKKKKKKKGLRQNSEWFFSQVSQVQTSEGGLFSYGGGLFSIFHRKSASKAQNTCVFAYFTSQWGRLEPPPPPPWLRYWMNCINCLSSRSRINSNSLLKRCWVCLTDQYACQTAILHLISWVNFLAILWVDEKCKQYLNFTTYPHYVLWRNECPLISTWEANQNCKCILTFWDTLYNSANMSQKFRITIKYNTSNKLF